MKKEYIVTENPEEEQWKLLLRYGYPSNINKYFNERDYKQNNELTEFIAGSIMQAHAYFQAAKTSSMYITPLLIYYGVTNLLVGSASLKLGKELNIRGHGMRLTPPKSLGNGLSSTMINIVDYDHGGFSTFNKAFSQIDLPNGLEWSLQEVFSFIPDLRVDYENSYNISSNVIPIEIIKLRDRTVERINYAECPFYEKNLLNKIKDFNKNYLHPEHQENHIILNRKMKYEDIGVYSLHGRKFLQLSCKKKGGLINLSLLMAMYTGLYGLGYLSRYNPNIWNPFIQKDITGEKLLIEKFLSVSTRHLPNLVLNFITDKNIYFINETDGITDLRFTTFSEDINKIVEEQLKNLLHTKGLKYQ